MFQPRNFRKRLLLQMLLRRLRLQVRNPPNECCEELTMIQERKKIKYQLFGCMLGCILVLGGFAAAASAQTAPEAKPSPKPVRDGGRDPFRKYEPPKVSAR